MMWILHLLPDSYLEMLVNLILLVGVVASFLSFCVINRILRWWPSAAGVYHIAQLVSLAVLLLGVYFKGSYSTEHAWRERVAEMEQKVAAAEQRANQANTAIQTRVITKTKIVHDQVKKNHELIEDNKALINQDCKLNDAAISAYNQSVKNNMLNGDIKIHE